MSARPTLSPPALPPKPERDPFADPIATAFIDVVLDRGYEAAEVEEVVERAGIGQEEFDCRFADKEACGLAVFEALAADFAWSVKEAFDRHEDWRTGLRAAAYACADWWVEHPKAMRFGVLEVLAAESEMIRVRRDEVVHFCGSLIDAGREEAADPDSIPESVAAISVGSLAHLIAHRLQSPQEVDPHETIPGFMYIAVRPYLGEQAAREELAMERPEQ